MMGKKRTFTQAIIIAAIILAGVIALAFFRVAEPAIDAALVPTALPTALPPTALLPTALLPTPAAKAKTFEPTERPYSATSPWNTPIGASPQYDSSSDDMINTIKKAGNDGAIFSDPSQYTYPIYFADHTTPRWNVPCTKLTCTIISTDGVSKTDMLTNVPIPTDAKQSTGSDGQMIIIDKLTGAEYDLWQAQRTANGWEVSNGSIYNVFWDGIPQKYGSRGAGVPYYAGLIRAWEIEQGHIDHAIAFGYPTPARDRCVFPASKTDGKSKLQYAIPEGARLQLDPSLTDADFDRMGLDRTGKIIARALQTYGMFLIDVSGRSKIYVENLDDNPLATRKWSDPELNLTSTTIADLPYSAFHVLELPKAYRDSSIDGPMHGKCFAP